MPPIITEAGKIHLKWALTDGVGPLTFSRMLIQFGDAESGWGASASMLSEIKRLGPKSAEQIARSRETVEIDGEVEAAAEHGVRIICRADDDYPPGLRQIADAPIVLYIKGELLPTDAVAMAIVGTRQCSIYGGEQARRFGELLAGAGFTVVSGLARGIDGMAHHGAVEAGGRSIAVMGKGLTEIYPPENHALAEKLLETGAWISELPMNSEIRRENFPGRNRIIAGMTLGTLVIEAPQRSGALITARLASEYNREVFAVPGRAQDPMCFGSNDLIRRAYAKLTMCLEDILDELGEIGDRLCPREDRLGGKQLTLEDAAGAPNIAAGAQKVAAGASPAETPSNSDEAPSRPVPKLTEAQRLVFEAVPFDPVLQDAVMQACQLPPGEVLAAFTALELKGLIKRLPGQLVVRAGKA